MGKSQNHDVYFANTHVGVLKNGGEIEVPVEIGKHTIYFRSKMKKFGKNANFTAVVNQDDEIVELQTRFDANGNYVVKYADNKPHIPTFISSINKTHESELIIDTNKVSAEKQLTGQTALGFCCPKCGSDNLVIIAETSTKGKDFDVGNACCGLLLFGPIGALCGAMGKGKETSSTTYWLCKGCGNKFRA